MHLDDNLDMMDDSAINQSESLAGISKVAIADLDGYDGMFDELQGDETQLLMAENPYEMENAAIQNYQVHEPASPGKNDKQPGSSSHLFQEMAVVRSRLNFDEQEFRESVHQISSEISQEFKGTCMINW